MHCLLFMCALSCPSLCDPLECSPLDSSVHGIFQATIVDWVAISSSGGIFLNQGKPMSPESSALQAISLSLYL